MFKRVKNSKLVYFLAFLMVVSSIGGCGWDKKDSKFLPTFQDRAAARTAVDSLQKAGEIINDTTEPIFVNGLKVEVKGGVINFPELGVSIPTEDIRVSDADVIGFSSDLQKALRRRMDRARRVRLGSGSIQVIAAATGATLGLMTGDVATAAVFAAVSAVMPEFQHIFQAKERSEAYEQGLELIQDADARYYKKMTENTGIQTIKTNELTKEGAELLSEIAACLKLVDKAILQTIPSIEDLQAATGRLEEGLGQIKLVPKKMNIDFEGTQTVNVINGKVITYSIDNISVVKIKNIDDFNNGTDKIIIRGAGTGTSKVTVFNALGRSGYFDVTVGSATPTLSSTVTLEEGLGQIKLVPKKMNIAFQGTHTVHVIGKAKVINYSTDTIGVVNIVDFDFDNGTDKIKIVGVGIGSSTVTVFDGGGRSGCFDVIVGTGTPILDAKVSPAVTIEGDKSNAGTSGTSATNPTAYPAVSPAASPAVTPTP